MDTLQYSTSVNSNPLPMIADEELRWTISNVWGVERWTALHE